MIGKVACAVGFYTVASYLYSQFPDKCPHVNWMQRSVAFPTSTPDTSAVRACLDLFEEKCIDSTIHKIAHAVGGIGAFCNLPVLPWQKRFIAGHTPVINGVRPEDLSAPMMRGVDEYSRPFVAVRMEAEDPYAKRLGVETIFQKYTGRDEPWESGSADVRNPIVYATVDEEALERIEQLVLGKAIKLTKSYSNEVVHKKLA